MGCYWFGLCIFFFKQKTAYEMRISDWSSDVCSSDLAVGCDRAERAVPARRGRAAAAGRTGGLRPGAGLVAGRVPQRRGPGLGARVDGPVRAAALRRAHLERAVEPRATCRTEEHTSELQYLLRIP